MPLRFLEVRLPIGVHEEAEGVAESHDIIDQWCEPGTGDKEVHRFLLESQHVEGLVDALRSRFGEEVRMVLMPVEATLPRTVDEQATEEPPTPPETEPVKAKSPSRVSREELYEDIGERIALTPTFMVLAVVSVVVAGIGLLRDDLVAIIGAMVIAPLLGPNVGLALATTLGDLDLGRKALRSGLTGIGLSFLVAFGMGWLFGADPAGTEIAARISPDLGHLVLALASGVAGGLAFTTGLPASLIGVMVAVALLPPLAAGGLLLGSGHQQESLGAFVLLGTNLIAVNLAAVATFLAQGIRPLWSSDQEKARRAAHRALFLWTVLLLVMAAVLVWVQTGGLD